MTVFTNSESAWNLAPFIWRAFLFVAWFLWGFLWRRRSSFTSLTTATVARVLRVMTETAWVSFGTLPMCLPLKTLSLSPQRRISFLFDCWWLILFPQHRSRLWSFEFSSFDQHEVLQLSSIVNYSAVHCFKQFLDRIKPRQCEAEQNPVILVCMILPGSHQKAFHSLITELDPIQRRNLGRRHSVNWKWTRLSVLVLLRRLRLHGNTHRSCTQFVFLVRIGRFCWAGCSSTHTLFRKWMCMLRSFFFFKTNTTIVSSISKSGKSVRSTIDRDVTSSSSGIAISTSVIQCKVIWGFAVLVHTAFLKLT